MLIDQLDKKVKELKIKNNLMETELSVLSGLGKEPKEILLEKLNRTMLDLQMKV